MPDDISIRSKLRAGDLGRIIALHGEVYDVLPGFGLAFEAYVGQTIAEFVLDANTRGRIWLVERNGILIGCTAVVLRDQQVGQVRWVVVVPSARGQGIGKNLMHRAIQYCRDEDCRTMALETTDGLAASRGLYEKLGFKVASETIEELWDGRRPLIRLKMDLD